MVPSRSLPQGIPGTRIALALALLSLSCCAGGPPPPVPGRGSLWGRVTLRPHQGVTPGSKDLTVYGDRRLRDVEFVDYGNTEFAVVYLEDDSSPGGTVFVNLESSVLGSPRLVPRHGAVGKLGRVVVRNSDSEAHTLACPRAGWIRVLGPSQESSFIAENPGETSIFVLDLPQAEARFFVSPGPFAELPKDGRWELRDLAPGPRTLRVWHPRFPPERRAVTVLPDRILRVDLVLSIESVESAGQGD